MTHDHMFSAQCSQCSHGSQFNATNWQTSKLNNNSSEPQTCRPRMESGKPSLRYSYYCWPHRPFCTNKENSNKSSGASFVFGYAHHGYRNVWCVWHYKQQTNGRFRAQPTALCLMCASSWMKYVIESVSFSFTQYLTQFPVSFAFIVCILHGSVCVCVCVSGARYEVWGHDTDSS